MKTSLLALSFLFALSAHANYDNYALSITGQEGVEEVRMSAQLTKTIYQDQRVADTCYRQVHMGYRQQCDSRPQTICRDIYPRDYYGRHLPVRRECHVEFRTICSSVPNYSSEAYSCQKVVSVPVEVNDGTSQADINVRIRNNANGLTAQRDSCSLRFSLASTNLSYQAVCADFIVVVNNETSSQNRNGRNTIISKFLDITLLDAKKLLAPTSNGITEMRLEGQTLVFRTGDLTANPNFELVLKGDRKNLLKKDENLIFRNLSPSEYSFERYDESGGLVRINLDRLLGGINTSKKHEFEVTIRLLDNFNKAINVQSKREASGKVVIK